MLRGTAMLLLAAAALFSSGCLKGRFLGRASDCPEGQSRRGGVLCVPNENDAAKLGAAACKDPDLAALKAGVEVTMCDGSVGVGAFAACTEDGQVDCAATATNPSVIKANVEPSDIRHGKTIAGITGTKRDIKQCRNAAHSATWDTSGVSNIGKDSPSMVADATNVDLATDELNWSPTTYGLTTDFPIQLTTTGVLPTGLALATTYYVIPSGSKIKLAAAPGGAAVDIHTSVGSGNIRLTPVANVVVDLWDFIDDRNNGLASSPNQVPWSAVYVCDSSNFTNVSSLGLSGLAPTNASVGGTSNFTQIWRDELTGLYFTNILKDSTAGLRWDGVMQMCANINSGDGIGNWRLPTQKELMQLHVNGISRVVALDGGSLNSWFWSSTGVSFATDSVWLVYLAEGRVSNDLRTATIYGAFCVR